MKIMTYIYRIKCSSHDEYIFSKILKILSNFWYFQENTHSFYELHPVYTSCFTLFYVLSDNYLKYDVIYYYTSS